MVYENKAVVLGANYYIGLSAIRCLGSQGVHVAAVDYAQEDVYGFASKYCAERLVAPYYKEHPLETIDFLEEYAAKQAVKPLLIPCADAYVELIDPHYDRLSQVYLLPQSPRGLYTELLNKESLSRVASKHGVPIPEIVLPEEDGFFEKVEAGIGYPCLVKPLLTHVFINKFRTKMFVVNTPDELKDALSKVNAEHIDVFVQRIIPGFDDHMYTFDAYVDRQGQVSHWMTCQKQRQYPINFGASVYTKQLHVPQLYDIGAPFLEKVGYRGLAEIEFKKDARTGKFYLIEVNVRLSNLSSLFFRSGLNMPFIMYRDLTDNPLPPKNLTENTEVHFWSAFEDFFAVRGYLRTKQLKFWDVARSLLKPKAYAIWDWQDPMPAFAFLKLKLKKLISKFKRG